MVCAEQSGSVGTAHTSDAGVGARASARRDATLLEVVDGIVHSCSSSVIVRARELKRRHSTVASASCGNTRGCEDRVVDADEHNATRTRARRRMNGSLLSDALGRAVRCGLVAAVLMQILDSVMGLERHGTGFAIPRMSSFSETQTTMMMNRKSSLVPAESGGKEYTAKNLADESLQRYLDLRPPRQPKHERVRSCEIDMTLLAREMGRQRNGQPKVPQAVLMLDLDETSIYGNDGNDLALAMQWMGRPSEDIQQLYNHLISPCIADVYGAFQRQAERTHVVVYTRRPQMVRYSSCFRGSAFRLEYNPAWHKDGQIFFPSSIQTVDDIMEHYSGISLMPEEDIDIRSSLDRLLSARKAIMEELGLTTPPVVVVTASVKDVPSTLQHLHLPLEHAYLYDDNKDLKGTPHVTSVNPLQCLPSNRQKQLIEFLEERLPARLLDSELVEFLMESKPEERAIDQDAVTGELKWRVPVGDVPDWTPPKLSRKGSQKVLGLSRKESSAYEDGCLSPVTPELENSAGVVFENRGGHEEPNANADLKVIAELLDVQTSNQYGGRMQTKHAQEAPTQHFMDLY